ncbi:hypothetical protein MRB53_041928 [Persea americana]|nr:hypothetical protein MRB53_041928 [Persea americana]
MGEGEKKHKFGASRTLIAQVVFQYNAARIYYVSPGELSVLHARGRAAAYGCHAEGSPAPKGKIKRGLGRGYASPRIPRSRSSKASSSRLKVWREGWERRRWWWVSVVRREGLEDEWMVRWYEERLRGERAHVQRRKEG